MGESVTADPSLKTADEIAHVAAASLVEQLLMGAGAAIVIVSVRNPLGCVRTAMRFVNVSDRATQIRWLREFADILEGTVPGLENPA